MFPADCIPIRAAPSPLQNNRIILEHADGSHKPLAISQNCCFIINTHPRGMPGEHWLALYFNSYTQRLEYFDSFGLPVSAFPVVCSELSRRNLIYLIVEANSMNRRLQSVDSTVCGHYCALFLYVRSRMPLLLPAVVVNLELRNVAHSSQQRDRYVVRRIAELTRTHACCSVAMFSNSSVNIDAACTRFSQCNCCARDFVTMK